MTKTFEEKKRWHVEYNDGAKWRECSSLVPVKNQTLDNTSLTSLELAVEYRDGWAKAMANTSLADSPLRIMHESKKTTVEIETKEVSFVKEAYDEALKNLRAAEDNIARIRDACPHANFTKKAESSTGNYDPSCDGYWYHLYCSDCGRTKVIKQSQFNHNNPVWPK